MQSSQLKITKTFAAIGAFLILICNPEENYVTKPHLKDPIIGVLENTSHGNL
jgi:hypothetical protein